MSKSIIYFIISCLFRIAALISIVFIDSLPKPFFLIIFFTLLALDLLYFWKSVKK